MQNPFFTSNLHADVWTYIERLYCMYHNISRDFPPLPVWYSVSVSMSDALAEASLLLATFILRFIHTNLTQMWIHPHSCFRRSRIALWWLEVFSSLPVSLYTSGSAVSSCRSCTLQNKHEIVVTIRCWEANVFGFTWKLLCSIKQDTVVVLTQEWVVGMLVVLTGKWADRYGGGIRPRMSWSVW